MRAWLGETVIGIGPRRSLGRVLAGRGHPRRQLREPEAAPLADRSERRGPAPEVERDLIRLAHPVTAGDRDHVQNRPVYAA